MKPKQRIDIACGVVCLLFAAVYFYLAINLEAVALIEQISTKFVPELLATMIAGLSVLLIIVSLVMPSEPTEDQEPEQVDRPAFYGTVAVAFLSLAAWKVVGFLSMPLLIGGAMRANRNRNIFRIVCVSLGTTLVLYLVFFQLFEMPLPLGLWE